MCRHLRATPTVLMTALLLLHAPAANAHLMPRQRATVNIHGSAAFGAFSIPVSALRGWDDNADRRLSNAEFTAHYNTIVAQLNAGLTIASDGNWGRRDLLQPSADRDETDALAASGATHVLVLVQQTFARPLIALKVETTLFGTGPDEHQIIITAKRDGVTEVAVLEQRRAAHEFFAPSWRAIVQTLSLGAPQPITAAMLAVLAVLGALMITTTHKRYRTNPSGVSLYKRN